MEEALREIGAKVFAAVEDDDSVGVLVAQGLNECSRRTGGSVYIHVVCVFKLHLKSKIDLCSGAALDMSECI